MHIDEFVHLIENPRYRAIQTWEDGQVFMLNENGKHVHVGGVALVPIDGDPSNRKVITVVSKTQLMAALQLEMAECQ